MLRNPCPVSFDGAAILPPDNSRQRSTLGSAGHLNDGAQFDLHILGLVNKPRWLTSLLGHYDFQVGAGLGKARIAVCLAHVSPRVALLDREDFEAAAFILEKHTPM